jgi:hypothetical protein
MTTSFIVLVTCKLCKWKWHKRDFYPKEIIEKHLFTKKITAKIFIRGKGYIIWRINFLLLPLFSFIRRTRKTRFKLYHLWLIIYPSVFCFITQIYEAYIFAKLRGKCKKEKNRIFGIGACSDGGSYVPSGKWIRMWTIKPTKTKQST